MDFIIIKYLYGVKPKVTGKIEYTISGENRNAINYVKLEHIKISEYKYHIKLVGKNKSDKIRIYNILDDAKKIGNVLMVEDIREHTIYGKKIKDLKCLNGLCC